MAATRIGIVTEFASRTALSRPYPRPSYATYPKPGPSRKFFISLVICFPVTCMLWIAIIYAALKLAR